MGRPVQLHPSPSRSSATAEHRPVGRLVGLETEYAIRYAGADDRPRHNHIYDALIAALRTLVSVYKGDRLLQQQVFVDNGGAFYYEFQPTHWADGLVEGSTPECRGAAQVLVYQRAQEALLLAALRRVHPQLVRRGYFGRVGLLKNARDHEGRGYGTHENYEVDSGAGLRLFALRLGLVALMPVVVATNLLGWLVALTFAIVLFAAFLGWGVVAAVVPPARPGLLRWIDFDGREPPLERLLGIVSLRMTQVLQVPIDVTFGALYRATWFVPQRRALMAHLASRVLYTGSGCLLDGDAFWLSERATTLTSIERWVGAGTVHVVFDSGNLVKALWAPQTLRFSPIWGLFRRRHRFQIAVGDSNRCQVAEFLKVGTNLLLLDMIDAGRLRDAPRLLEPLEACRAIARDPSTEVMLRDGRAMTALDLQRWYLAQAEAYVEDVPDHAEYPKVIELWRSVLDAYEAGPERLIGRVDWVTKRYLIEAAALDDDRPARKKIDLRYGELGTGYYDRLAESGLTLDLVSADQIEDAMRRPPPNSPAEIRAEILADVASDSGQVYVAWDQVRIGSWVGGRVIRLQDYRKTMN